MNNKTQYTAETEAFFEWLLIKMGILAKPEEQNSDQTTEVVVK